MLHRNIYAIFKGFGFVSQHNVSACSTSNRRSACFAFATRFHINRALLTLVLLLTVVLAGCSRLLGPADEEPTTAPVIERALVPTFTATPEGFEPPATETPVPAALPATEQSTEDVEAESADLNDASSGNNENSTEGTADQASESDDASADEALPDDTQTDDAQTDDAQTDDAQTDDAQTDEVEPDTETSANLTPALTVSQVVNVRGGPGTEYGLVGAANAGQRFDIVGKNPAGDWWQICCVNGQQGWIYAPLATAQNADSVPLALNIPAPPPVQLPAPAAPAEPAPAEPAPAESAPAEPAPAEAEPAPPAADPCANIGGDGCKFKVRGGVQTADNGGGELRLMLFFIHSGVDGGQPQGSYFVGLLKDGQAVPVPDSVRSIALEKRDGPLGQFNYEYKVPLSALPGNSVAGNYTMWVIDGEGNRDSQDTSFTVPEGQGDVRVEWDQG